VGDGASASPKNSVNLKDIAAPAGERAGAIWSLDKSSDLNANLVRFGTGQGVEEHVNDEIEVMVLGVSGSGIVTGIERNMLYRPGYWCSYPRGLDARPRAPLGTSPT
jgi:cysteine synthase